MKEKPKQRISGLIRERLASFEEAQRIGISHQITVNQLNEEGFAISLGTFRTNLARARKARDKAYEVASQVRPTKTVRHDEIKQPKQPSPLLKLNQHSGFTMPPPLTPEELY